MKHIATLRAGGEVSRLSALYDSIAARWESIRNIWRAGMPAFIIIAFIYLMIILLALPLAS